MNSEQKRITIVCEGFEEYDYINRLKECSAWRGNYIIKPKNAKSLTKTFAVYQNEFNNRISDLVLVFCDTETIPYTQYKDLCKKINTYHNKRKLEKYVVFYANPCTMQIILMHFGLIKLSTNSKTQNARIIENLTGIKNYNADEHQRKALMNHINKENYEIMKKNIMTLPNDSEVVSSTNFGELISKLEAEDTTWVDQLIAKIER